MDTNIRVMSPTTGLPVTMSVEDASRLAISMAGALAAAKTKKARAVPASWVRNIAHALSKIA